MKKRFLISAEETYKLMADKMSQQNTILVSEYVAPSNWKCIWEQEIQRTINNAKHTKAIEKLFCYQGEINETI